MQNQSRSIENWTKRRDGAWPVLGCFRVGQYRGTASRDLRWARSLDALHAQRT